MNIGTLILSLIGLLVIVIAFSKFKKLKAANPQSVQLFSIWLIGLISFIIGIGFLFWEVNTTFETIEVSGNISPNVVAGQIKKSLIYPILGLLIFIGSFVLWGILKNKKNAKIFELEKYASEQTTLY